MNSHAKTVIDFLEQFRHNIEIMSENTANKKSSTSLEDLVQETLLKAGFQDLTGDLDNCHKGLLSYFSTADFLIIINGYMLYWEIKTGGGLAGKLNDKPIPAQFFVLMCSRHKEAKESPFTWFQMADLMNDKTYNYYNKVLAKYAEFVKEIRTVDGYDKDVQECASRPSLRGIVGWGKGNNDWYRKTCNGLDRTRREQNVINILKNL